jgi:cytidyltransferase-like protein
MRIGILGGTFDPVHVGHVAAGVSARHVLQLDRVLFVVANAPWQKAGRRLATAEDRFDMVKAAIDGLDALDGPDRPDRPHDANGLDRLDPIDRPKGLDGPDRPDGADRPDGPDRPDRPDGPHDANGLDGPDPLDRPDRPDGPDRSDRPDGPHRLGGHGLEPSRMEIDRGGTTFTADTVNELHRLHPTAELFLIVGTDVADDINAWERVEEIRTTTTLAVVTRPGAAPVPMPGWRVEQVEMPLLAISSTELRNWVAQGRPVDGLVPPGAVRLLRERGLYAGSG